EGACPSVTPAGPRPPWDPPELTEEVWKTHFADVYERDRQIRRIHQAVRTSVRNGIPGHCILYSLPGAAKTILCKRFMVWYNQGQPVMRAMFVDCTTMTKAGLERWLIDLADKKLLPEVLFMDELEKMELDNGLCLLGVMASGMLCRM